VAAEIAYSHHERWDGTGYPQQLAAEDIPLSARVMAVADVYDALISRRVYKPPMSANEALEIIRDGRGSHFDPRIVDCFLNQNNVFRLIAAQYSDETTDEPEHIPAGNVGGQHLKQQQGTLS
jgi:putative two-component system response regulator